MQTIQRPSAIAAGLTRYFTGESCRHGHVAERMTSNRRCVQCSTEQGNAWKRAHPAKMAAQRRSWSARNYERDRAFKKAWAAAHPEQQAARSRKHHLANREKTNAAHAAWALRNPGKLNALAAKRRADELLRTPVWADLRTIDSIYISARKQREAGMEVDVDHVLPLRGKFVSGLHVPENLQIIPALLNKQKSNRLHF